MNKCWYAVYTRPQSEKKVAAQLARKKIEHICPVNRIAQMQGNRRKLNYEPLFPSLVFVYITEAEMPIVRQTSEVLNFLYWLGAPAVIKAGEIEQILEFSGMYHNIRVFKSAVNANGTLKLSREPYMDLSEGLVSNTTMVKLTLPSLGFVLAAESEKNIDRYTYGVGDSKLVI